MDNAKIADSFEELADLLELKGENPFRIRAYRSGARAIRDLDTGVAELLNDPEKNLVSVSGIGKTLVEKCETLIATGTLPQLEQLREDFPAGVLAMIAIPGVGAKKAAQLHRELGISDLDALQAACTSGAVQKLKGFGAKTEQAILAGLSLAATAQSRLRWA